MLEKCRAFSRQERKYDTFNIYITFFLLHKCFLVINISFSTNQGEVSNVNLCVYLLWWQSCTLLLVFHTEETKSFLIKWIFFPTQQPSQFSVLFLVNIFTSLHTGSRNCNCIPLTLSYITFLHHCREKEHHLVMSLGYTWQIPIAQHSLSLMSFVSSFSWAHVLRCFPIRFSSYLGWWCWTSQQNEKIDPQVFYVLFEGLLTSHALPLFLLPPLHFFLLPLLSPLHHFTSKERWVRAL